MGRRSRSVRLPESHIVIQSKEDLDLISTSNLNELLFQKVTMFSISINKKILLCLTVEQTPFKLLRRCQHQISIAEEFKFETWIVRKEEVSCVQWLVCAQFPSTDRSGIWNFNSYDPLPPTLCHSLSCLRKKDVPNPTTPLPGTPPPPSSFFSYFALAINRTGCSWTNLM